MRLRSLVTAGVLAVCVALPAQAAAPAQRTLYAYQPGCGVGPARLLPVVRHTTPGCGYTGGLPGPEVGHAVGGDVLGIDLTFRYRYASEVARVPLVLDRSRPVTGRVAAEGWYADAGLEGGVGQVTWDVQLLGVTTGGASVLLGADTVSATVLPGTATVSAAYRIKLPATVRPLRQVLLDVSQRGVNVGMSARHLDGATRVVLPLRR